MKKIISIVCFAIIFHSSALIGQLDTLREDYILPHRISTKERRCVDSIYNLRLENRTQYYLQVDSFLSSQKVRDIAKLKMIDLFFAEPVLTDDYIRLIVKHFDFQLNIRVPASDPWVRRSSFPILQLINKSSEVKDKVWFSLVLNAKLQQCNYFESGEKYSDEKLNYFAYLLQDYKEELDILHRIALDPCYGSNIGAIRERISEIR